MGQCIFANEDGTSGAVVQGTVTSPDYTTMVCQAPSHDPHKASNCSSSTMCQGVQLTVTNDGGVIVGSQYMGPKWNVTTGVATRHGPNPHKYLFSDIFVSVAGSDASGDGSFFRPFQTLARAL